MAGDTSKKSSRVVRTSTNKEVTMLDDVKNPMGNGNFAAHNPTTCNDKIIGVVPKLGARKQTKSDSPPKKRARKTSSSSSRVIAKSGVGESSTSKLFCGICMDEKTVPEMFKGGCPHSYCRTCIGRHVAAKIGENVIRVKCPELDCGVFVEPQHCRSFVSRQVLDRWEAAVCEASLGSKKTYCPFRECSAVLLDEDGEWGVTPVECPHCHRLFCAKCRDPWHAGERCQPKADELDNQFMELAEKEKWQKCSNCNFYIQRTEGCESIRCSCGHKFCYMCGRAWSFGHLCKGEDLSAAQMLVGVGVLVGGVLLIGYSFSLIYHFIFSS